MRRLLILPAVAVVCAAEIYRRGFVAPILYGVRQHCRSRPARYFEPDYMA
jgi:hypothetical protein